MLEILSFFVTMKCKFFNALFHYYKIENHERHLYVYVNKYKIKNISKIYIFNSVFHCRTFFYRHIVPRNGSRTEIKLHISYIQSIILTKI